MNSDVKIITERISVLFQRKMQTKYWLVVVDDPYDQTYNFFFNSQKKWLREKSIPLHTIHNHQLAYLETVIAELQKQTKLSITYTGFTGQIWPDSQRIIQRKKQPLE